MTTTDKRKSSIKGPPPLSAGVSGGGPAKVDQAAKPSGGAAGAERFKGDQGDHGHIVRRELVVFVGVPDGSDFAQVAAGWFSLLADPRKAVAILAAPQLPVLAQPDVVAAMAEAGVRVNDVDARVLTPHLLRAADLVVTIARSFDRVAFETHPPLYREHWRIEADALKGDGGDGGDGGSKRDGMTRVRSMRDLVRSRVAMLVFTEGWVRADIPREEAHVTGRARHKETRPAF